MIMLHVHRRRFHRVTLLGLAVLWLLTVGVPGVTADDDESFSNRSLRGAYGFIASGTLNDNAALAVGRYTFHGNGTCALTLTVNVNNVTLGGVGPIVATACTYAVQPDGTGTISVDVPGFGPFTFAFVIVDNKKELHLITLDPGVSATVLVKKQ
jgi:hypothetical protein